ncbi:hypothetical protein [Caloranaerobacter sp. DY30410]|uniref:hypothetical protein n=1 Tax=Caloranaerobacter sp. DY30410 TaxID=3238305 RepID=UPI003D08D0F8
MKRVNKKVIDNLEFHLKYQNKDIIALILSLSKLKENDYTYESIKASIEKFNRLKDINDLAIKILNIKGNTNKASDVEELKFWVEKCLDNIEGIANNKSYIDLQYLKKKIDIFINNLENIRKIRRFIDESKVNINYKYKTLSGNETLAELEDKIIEMENYLFKENGELHYSIYNYFRSLIVTIRHISTMTKLSEELIEKIDKIYKKLDNNYEEKLFDKMGWLYCGFVMTEIINNYEKAN